MHISVKDAEATTLDLPPELLAYVFQLAQPHQYTPNKIPRIEVTVSHVSGYWRAVALTEPRLWNHIDIHSNRSLKRIATYLERSGPKLLLDIDIDIYQYDKALLATDSLSKANLFQTAVGAYILQNIHRIRSLSCICYDKQTLINVMHAVSRSAAPSLRRLVMKYDISSEENQLPNNRSTPVLNAGAPRLSYLESDMIDTRSNLDSLRNLTTLDLHLFPGSTRHTYDSFVEMLKAPRSLLYLSLEGCVDVNSWPLHTSGPQFELKKLNGLRLIGLGIVAAKFLLSVSAPQLKSLWSDTTSDNFHFLFDAPQMAVVNGRSKFPALKYLTTVCDSLVDCVKFSEIFPTITHLHFGRPYFSAVNSLDKALENGWASMDTLVFTMFKESRGARDRLYGVLTAIFVYRRAQGRPIRRFLLDRDHFHDMMTNSPGVAGNVETQVISSTNYDEDWWNKVDKLNL